jgi:SAM-dependent methyltransferase
MAEYEPSTYGERIAEDYERLMPAHVAASASAIVEFLASVAKRPRALELGIGTGRIAIPLRERGFDVSGIDASPAMVKKMHAKKGGAGIPVEFGDFGDVKVRGKFPLIYVVWNTFFALLTQDAQMRCFERIARRLTADGVFVMEAFVPDVPSFHEGQRVKAIRVEVDTVSLEVTQHDQAAQTVTSMHVVISERGTQLYPVRLRYAYPPELDLMAYLAGLRLRERFGGWHREPFSSASPYHVSVYELNSAAGTATQRRASGRRK